MIEAFTGLPGMGKTYNMTRRALQQIKKGRKVYANYHITGAEYFKELGDIVNVRNALILIDEAGIYLPAQAWKSIPFEFMRQIRQHRHDGLDLWYTAQDLQDVVTHLRRVTQFQRDFTRIWKICFEKTINPKTRIKYGFDISILNKNVFSYYDTTENIELGGYLLDELQNKKEKKVCSKIEQFQKELLES